MENPPFVGHVLQKPWISIYQDAQLCHLPNHPGSSRNLLQTDPCPVPSSQSSAQVHVVQALSFQRGAIVDRPKIGVCSQTLNILKIVLKHAASTSPVKTTKTVVSTILSVLRNPE